MTDFLRLQKALAVEADRGFSNLQGRQFLFHEFCCQAFNDHPPDIANGSDRRRWYDLAHKYRRYPALALEERQRLVIETRRFVQQLHQYSDQAQRKTPQERSPRLPKVKDAKPKAVYKPQGLETPLMFLKNMGKRKGAQLKRLGLETVKDALLYYPRDYIDYARQVAIAELEPGETVTIMGTAQSCRCFSSPNNGKLTIFELVLRDASGHIRISRFYAGHRYSNRGWQEKMKRQFPRGSMVAASGLVKESKYGLNLDNPEFEVLDSQRGKITSLKVGRVLPVYPLTEGVLADTVRQAVLEALAFVKLLKDPFPTALRETYGLEKLPQAIAQIHFPTSSEDLAQARRRLVFDEFFYLQLGFLQRRRELKQEETAPFTPQGKLIEQFSQILPFTLTGAQQRVINEIMADLQRATPMNRLVQGDVGAGKTVVAVFAILAAIQSGYQAALMAPTEVLAEQHYRKLVGWFNLLHLPVELLTGSTKTKKRREIHGHLETGQLKVLVGTHALIQDPVIFQNLGLVVIDEQHRFGVQQRARLLAKGKSPHTLSMTATPIPRTLALTLHGDLEVSQIDELPPGRQAIKTQVLSNRERIRAYDLIKREVAQGRQAYIILPLVEESEKLDLKAAVEEHQHLSEQVFPDFSVGLLHGKMKSQDKDGALTAFRDRQTQIIVSTTVIEVGVDVPNATVMLIEHAERFGLSQLHQLRGRVGRGSHQSHCLLMTGTKNPESRQRLNVLAESQDGFWISEMDLRFRGPGEVLGTRQSGLPDFALASLVEDQEVLFTARTAAERLLEIDPHLEQHPAIKRELSDRHRQMIGGEVLN